MPQSVRTVACSLCAAAIVAAGAVHLAAQPAAPQGPPRGASAPPEHAKVTPINHLPNPYETVRNFGTLPDGRKWGSVSAVAVSPEDDQVILLAVDVRVFRSDSGGHAFNQVLRT